LPQEVAADEKAHASLIPFTIALYTPCPSSARRFITETKALSNAKLSNFILRVNERLRRDLCSLVSLNHKPLRLEEIIHFLRTERMGSFLKAVVISDKGYDWAYTFLI